MALQRYNAKLSISGDKFWYRPASVEIPLEAHKYIQSTWNPDYSLFRLAYLTYGRADLYWLIMRANDITDPYSFKDGDKFRILLPDYLNEVVVNENA